MDKHPPPPTSIHWPSGTWQGAMHQKQIRYFRTILNKGWEERDPLFPFPSHQLKCASLNYLHWSDKEKPNNCFPSLWLVHPGTEGVIGTLILQLHKGHFFRTLSDPSDPGRMSELKNQCKKKKVKESNEKTWENKRSGHIFGITARKANRCVLTLFKPYKHIQFCLKQSINNKRKENKWESQDQWKCMRKRMSQTIAYKQVSLPHYTLMWAEQNLDRNDVGQMALSLKMMQRQ